MQMTILGMQTNLEPPILAFLVSISLLTQFYPQGLPGKETLQLETQKPEFETRNIGSDSPPALTILAMARHGLPTKLWKNWSLDQ